MNTSPEYITNTKRLETGGLDINNSSGFCWKKSPKLHCTTEIPLYLHLIPLLFCAGATIWNFSIFYIVMVFLLCYYPDSLPLWISTMENQPCTAHFAFSWMEIQKGPKRHPDRFRLKKSCLSSFKGLYKEKWTPPNMCHPPPMQRTQLLNNQCTTYFLCSFPGLLYIYILYLR